MNQRYNQCSRYIQCLFIIIAVLSMAQPASADEDGRYRAIVMHDEGRTGQPGSLFPKVFIIDSRDGHMWTWEEKKKIKGLENRFSFGTVVTYQGRVKPGKTMGEIVDKTEGR